MITHDPRIDSTGDLFENAFHFAAIGMAIVALDGRLIRVNPAFCRLLGYDQAELVLRDFQSITHPDDLEADVNQAWALMAGTIASYQMDKRYFRKDGGIVWVRLTASILRDGQGAPLHFIAQVEDMSARKEAERQRDLFFGMAFDMFAIANREGYLIRVNPAWTRSLGWGEEELTSRPFISFVHPDDLHGTREEMRRLLEGMVHVPGFTNRYLCRDGTYLWLEWNTSIGPDGLFYCAVRDITARKAREASIIQLMEERERYIAELREQERRLNLANAKLQELSGTDFLMGIANRRRLDETLAAEWNRAARSGEPVALLMLDIDHFKAFNDAYGHVAGDDCLRAVAEEVQAAVPRPEDLVARFGGEELAVVLPRTNGAGALQVAERIRDRLAARAIAHARSPVASCVTVSIGVASRVPGRDGKVSDLVRAADAALYQAKKSGRDRAVSAPG